MLVAVQCQAGCATWHSQLSCSTQPDQDNLAISLPVLLQQCSRGVPLEVVPNAKY